ncbi:MAG: hypothetical protein ACK5QX_01365 [bacterium]|jgi:hypothetical protein
MDFPEKQIFTEIIARLKNNSNHFIAANHEPPVCFDWDRNQDQPEEEVKDLPFNRPAILIRFGEMTYEAQGSRSRRGTVPISIKVVQDKTVDAGEDLGTQELFTKLLEYKYLVNDLLEYLSTDCFSAFELLSMETDHSNRMLHVETIQYRCKVTLIRKQNLPD